MSSATAKKPLSYWINSAIVLFFFFGFGMLPSIFDLSYVVVACV